MKNFTKKIFMFLGRHYKIILILLILATFFYRFMFAPVKVESFKVRKGNITENAMGTGTLEAKIKLSVSSEISGRIRKIYVDQGDKVEAGQLLVELDKKEYKLQASLAEAHYKTVMLTLNKLKSDLKYARVIFVNEKINYYRNKKLIKNKAVSQKQYDEAVKKYGMAEAKLNHAKEALLEGENKICEAKQAYDLSIAELEETEIRSPFNGIIILRERETGDTVVTSTPILELIATKTLWIRSWVSEINLSKLKIGQQANIIFRSEPYKTYGGTVGRIAKKVDSETREFIVDVKVKNLPKNWAIGQRAEVYIKTNTKKNVPFVPREYIFWRDKKPGVFKDKSGDAIWMPVALGMQNSNIVELTKGVNSGESVIKSSIEKVKLKNGNRVKENESCV
jgi:HlyD family secretion protein